MSIKVFKDPPEVADDMRQVVVTHLQRLSEKSQTLDGAELLVKNIKVS